MHANLHASPAGSAAVYLNHDIKFLDIVEIDDVMQHVEPHDDAKTELLQYWH